MTATNPPVIWIENVAPAEEPRWGRRPDDLRLPLPYRRVRRGAEAPPGSVWLEPGCADSCEEERTWCTENAWGSCDECGRLPKAYAPAFRWQTAQEAWRRG